MNDPPECPIRDPEHANTFPGFRIADSDFSSTLHGGLASSGILDYYYHFLGRVAINRKGKVSQFAAFEEREWGTRGTMNNRGLDPGPVYLRVESRNNRILGSTSKDGKTWAKLDPMEPSYPSILKVGIYAINGCNEPTTVAFEDFAFTEGTAAKAKARAK